MSYKKLWTDLHANIHHNQMGDLDAWIGQARQVLDFWPVAYYPMYMRRNEAGAPLEDLYPEEAIQADWEQLRAAVKRVNEEGWPMFMGYEWQGDGSDGDHNVFYLHNDGEILLPRKYLALRDALAGHEAIAVPHHVAYKPGSRGKNWSTHDEKFSPIAEIYSSHGSSENDDGPIPMERHDHMGPRITGTCYESGAAMGYHLGGFGVVFIAVILWLFSFSTFLGILFYARPNVAYLFGDNWLSQTLYKLLALAMLFVGGLAAYQFVWDLGDVGVGLMTVFNMIALVPLAPQALACLRDYEEHRRGK